MRLVTGKLVGYAFVTAVGLLLGLLLHRPSLVLLVAPFAVLLVVGAAGAARPELEVSAALSAERVLEGDELELRFQVRAGAPLGRVELTARLPGALVRDGTSSVALDITRPGVHVAVLPLRPGRWGAYEVGPLAWRVRGPGDLVRHEGIEPGRLALRVLPRREALRLLVEPARTTPFSGSHTIRAAGAGIEFAELALHGPGEALRDLNPRVSARRNALWVNRRHPERDANVVLLVDTTSEVALEPAVRAAAALVAAHAGAHDRIGVVAFGSLVRWVVPGLGDRHVYRVLDALLAAHAVQTAYWHDLGVLPPPVLPANALLWMVSPLADDRPAGVAVDLRRRHHDVSVLEVELEPLFPPGPAPEDQLAHRLWRLRRQARRDTLRRAGVAVVGWSEGRSVRAAVAEAAAFRARRTTAAR